MKKLKAPLFLLLLCGVLGLSLIFAKEKFQPPFSRSLAPLLQALGKPIQTADRAVSRLLLLDSIDEKMLGDTIKQQLAKWTASKSPEDETTVKYLNALVHSLTDETNQAFEYQVFLYGGYPNACAMPGGAICVTKGLMKALENEAELVAVLGHEIGHIERGHLFDAARGEMLKNKVSSLSLLSYALEVGRFLLDFTFSKTQEDEADGYGFRMLLAKGYDPMAMSTAFEKLRLGSEEEPRDVTDPVDDFFTTHPHLEHRIEKFRSRAELVSKNLPKEKRYLGKKNFQERIPACEGKFAEE